MSRKLTLEKVTYINGIKKIAHSSKSDSHQKYTIISRRVSFGVIILAILYYSVFTFLSSDESVNIKTAGNTPSETSILKIQVMDLEQKNAQLQAELNRYKEKYGELDDNK